MTSLLSVQTTFFTLWGYPMSYLEFVGTLCTIWCVWLTAKARVLSWPVGIVGSVLYIFLFYQIQLYSDLFEQIYYLITGFMGWWLWTHVGKAGAGSGTARAITVNTWRENGVYATVIALGTIVLAYIVSNLPVWLPTVFPEPAVFPVLDAFTTVASLVAQWLLTKKKLENWILWIVVDSIGIFLYWARGVKFISLEYALFLGIATFGYIRWLLEYRNTHTYVSHQTTAL